MAPILQTIASLDSRSGGTSTCTYDLVKALNASGMPTDILTLQPGSRNPGLPPDQHRVHLQFPGLQCILTSLPQV